MYLTDGDLTPMEYEHQKASNFCLYCGTSGHFYHSCEHPSSSASLRKPMLKAELDESTEEHCSILDEVPGSGNA
jgi:hypothetical protein